MLHGQYAVALDSSRYSDESMNKSVNTGIIEGEALG